MFEREKILNVVLNLFKVKSIVTFATVGILVYLVNNQIETATTTAIIMMVFQNFFDKSKKDKDE